MEREPSASAAAPAAAALFAWGANSYGQLGLGHKEDVLLPQQLSDFCNPGCVKRITGGGAHSAVVTDEGSLFVCGLNKDGQLGLGHTKDVLYFTPCKSLLGCPIQQVACGWDFTIILTENGQVLSCGSNSFGQLGIPLGPRRCVVPQAIELLREKVVSIAAGLRHALAATASGTVFQWGTGLASSGRRLCPGQTLPLFLTAKEPSRVTDAGELFVWGSNKHGQLASQAAFLPVPQKIEAHCFQNEKVAAVWNGWTHLVAQTETGKVFTWGRADYGQLGRTLESHEDCKPKKQDPSLRCSRPSKSTPSSLHCLMGATEVSCGSEHNLAVIARLAHSAAWGGSSLKHYFAGPNVMCKEAEPRTAEEMRKMRLKEERDLPSDRARLGWPVPAEPKPHLQASRGCLLSQHTDDPLPEPFLHLASLMLSFSESLLPTSPTPASGLPYQPQSLRPASGRGRISSASEVANLVAEPQKVNRIGFILPRPPDRWPRRSGNRAGRVCSEFSDKQIQVNHSEPGREGELVAVAREQLLRELTEAPQRGRPPLVPQSPSVPLPFACVLHSARGKNLKWGGREDLSDDLVGRGDCVHSREVSSGRRSAFSVTRTSLRVGKMLWVNRL
nr:secretion-regulating guanine nucleotide exchange factor isoform X3 [Kogia breviceps]